MRIRSIRFANLNSLYGEWMIDLSSPQFVRDGLFAITGPTGSGKSTILDAICLALYGRTPRLDSIGLQANEIMSRQEGFCFSEVTFETAKGLYRCHWEQHRARKRPDGNLVDAKHEFTDLLKKSVLFTKKREVAQAVEEATGMSFDRFTRSMLLAQGQFAAFLSADADQRSPILEQITGTEIYSEISRRVHLATSRQRATVEAMEQEVEGLRPLSESELEATRSRAFLYHRWVDTANRRVRALEDARSTINALQENEQRFTALVDALKSKQELSARIEEQRQRLYVAERALELQSSYATLCQRRETLSLYKRELASLEERFPEAQRREQESQEEMEKSIRQLAVARSEQQAAQKILSEVRLIDGRYASLQTESDSVRRLLSDNLRERCERTKAVGQAADLHAKQQRVVDAARSWILRYKGDAELETHLIALHAEAATLGVEENKHRNILARHQDVFARMQLLKNQRDSALDELASLTGRHGSISGEIDVADQGIVMLLEGKLVREYEAEREHLQEKRTLIAAISSLEDHRAHLREGAPCPLCGATEHPYLAGSIPSDDGISERLAQIGSMLTEHARLLSEKEVARSCRSDLDIMIAAKRSSIDALERQLEELSQKLVALTGDRERAETNMNHAREVFEKSMAPWISGNGNPDELLSVLEERSRAWIHKNKELATASQQQESLGHTLERLQDKLSQAELDIAKIRERLGLLRQSAQAQLLARIDLFGQQDPEEVELRLDRSVKESEALQQASDDQSRKAARETDGLRDAIAQSHKRIEETAMTLSGEEHAFAADRNARGFLSEDDFLGSRLETVERKSLKETIELYDRELSLLHHQHDDTKQARERLLEHSPLGWTREAIQEERGAAAQEVQELYQRLGALEERLLFDDRQRQRHDAHRRQLSEQQTRLMRWERLNALIGSHDGKKYRNYAQHLTFEMLVAHANEHLGELSDRYVLTADPSRALEFSVMDLYQAGEVRSARNLSGGESFLVSLALSLGLSTIASKKVQVDSLFLDEGFGTLDEQALETALSALSSLRGKGKLVGIISHVGALQERIPVRISVVPGSGGRSRIQGPGCSRIA